MLAFCWVLRRAYFFIASLAGSVVVVVLGDVGVAVLDGAAASFAGSAALVASADAGGVAAGAVAAGAGVGVAGGVAGSCLLHAETARANAAPRRSILFMSGSLKVGGIVVL